MVNPLIGRNALKAELEGVRAAVTSSTQVGGTEVGGALSTTVAPASKSAAGKTIGEDTVELSKDAAQSAEKAGRFSRLFQPVKSLWTQTRVFFLKGRYLKKLDAGTLDNPEIAKVLKKKIEKKLAKNLENVVGSNLPRGVTGEDLLEGFKKDPTAIKLPNGKAKKLYGQLIRLKEKFPSLFEEAWQTAK